MTATKGLMQAGNGHTNCFPSVGKMESFVHTKPRIEVLTDASKCIWIGPAQILDDWVRTF